MYTPICSADTFEKLEKAGIIDLVKDTVEVWYPVLLNGPLSENASKLIDSAKQGLTGGFDQALIDFEKKVNAEDDSTFFGGFRKDIFYVENPILISYLAIEDSLNQFAEVGFSSVEDLETAVTALCIGDENILKSDMGSNYEWRNNGFQTSVSNETHGDFFFHKIIQIFLVFGVKIMKALVLVVDNMVGLLF